MARQSSPNSYRLHTLHAAARPPSDVMGVIPTVHGRLHVTPVRERLYGHLHLRGSARLYRTTVCIVPGRDHISRRLHASMF